MPTALWTDEDTRRAKEAWQRYQREHDITPLLGRTAGIDPKSGDVLFGDSLEDVHGQMERAGNVRPLYFVRVGKDYYFRKGGHR